SLSICFDALATAAIYTLSLHDALPILRRRRGDLRADHAVRLPRGTGRARGHGRSAHRPLRPRAHGVFHQRPDRRAALLGEAEKRDRKSTRLNSSHLGISYAVFCLKKKK